MTPRQFFFYEKSLPRDSTTRETKVFKERMREVQELIRMYGESSLDSQAEKS